MRLMADVVIPFVKDLDFEYGVLSQVSPNVRRLIAHKHPNSGRYLFEQHELVQIVEAVQKDARGSAEAADRAAVAVGGELLHALADALTHIQHELEAAGDDEVRQHATLADKQRFVTRMRKKFRL